MIAFSQRRLDRDVEREARDWFVLLLRDDVTPEEFARWVKWIDAAPENGRAYRQMSDTWKAAGEIELQHSGAVEISRDRFDGSTSVAIWRWRNQAVRVAAGALAACIVAGLLTSFLIGQQSNSVRSLVTEKGRHLSATLADGTVVHLAAESALEVKLEHRTRMVNLRKGEALFEIAHDKSRPFVVRTPVAAITAVGTAFDINIGMRSVVVDVTNGAVNVAPAAPANGLAHAEASIRLAAGQRLSMTREGGRLMLKESPGLGATWREGRLEYHNVRLAEVLDHVNRYGGRPIRIATPDIGDLEYTGTVRLDSTEAWALSLPSVFPVDAKLTNDAILLSRLGMIISNR